MELKSDYSNFSESTTKNIYKRTRTLAVECLHTVFEDILSAEFGYEWFETLKKDNKAISKSDENIYFCDLPVLLKVILSGSDSAKLISESTKQADLFLKVADATYKSISNFSEEKIANIESDIFAKAALNIAALIDFFPSVRDSIGHTFVSKIYLLISPLKQSTNKTPAYRIIKTIEDNRLSISVSDFIGCCIDQKVAVAFAEEAVFITEDYDKVIKAVTQHIKSKQDSQKSKNSKRLLMKIAVIVIAIIIAVASSTITSSIVNASLSKKYAKLLQNDLLSNIDTSSSVPSSSSEETDSSEPTSSDHLNSSSDTSSDASSNTSSVISTTQKTVDSKGRVTESIVIPYRYNGSNYVSYNMDMEDQKVVYPSLSQYYDYFGEQNISLYIYNETDNMIRNVGINFSIISESGKTIASHKEEKILSENSSISIASNSSYYYKITLDKNEVFDKNADLGFFKFKVSISYDIVQ